jgi:hypothetical protein
LQFYLKYEIIKEIIIKINMRIKENTFTEEDNKIYEELNTFFKSQFSKYYNILKENGLI